jgi:hypothetical protein
MRVKCGVLAWSSNHAMSVRRLVLLLLCLLLPIRSAGAAVLAVSPYVNDLPSATHSTCIASVVSQQGEQRTNDATSDVEQAASSLHSDHTCASLCAMAAVLPTANRYLGERASLGPWDSTPSFQRYFVSPPQEPPRPVA